MTFPSSYQMSAECTGATGPGESSDDSSFGGRSRSGVDIDEREDVSSGFDYEKAGTDSTFWKGPVDTLPSTCQLVVNSCERYGKIDSIQ